jgi:hypothetical protein
VTSRGFIVPLWPATRSGTDDALYLDLLRWSVVTFRSCNPDADLIVLDIAEIMPAELRADLEQFARVWTGKNYGDAIPWEENCFNKNLVAAFSPFDETAIIDADLIWVGSADGLFEAVGADDYAGVFCSQYRAKGGGGYGVCACVTVCKSREKAKAVLAVRPRAAKPNSDETLLDLAESEGLITRTSLPPEWAWDGRALFGGGPGPFHKWKNPAKWENTRAGGWTVDGLPIRAFHVSGVKRKALADRRLALWVSLCEGRALQIVRP